MLLNDTFVPHAYGEEIRMEKGKERHLQKPTFYPDEIIHHSDNKKDSTKGGIVFIIS